MTNLKFLRQDVWPQYLARVWVGVPGKMSAI
jgi:hypothetical protein